MKMNQRIDIIQHGDFKLDIRDLRKITVPQQKRLSIAKQGEELTDSLLADKLAAALAKELKPFYYTINLRCTLLLEDIGPKAKTDGSFINILAKNYKREAQNIKERYPSETEYKLQLKILDRAFAEVAERVAVDYTVNYLKHLTPAPPAELEEKIILKLKELIYTAKNTQVFAWEKAVAFTFLPLRKLYEKIRSIYHKQLSLQFYHFRKG
jgi:hypothetical protein